MDEQIDIDRTCYTDGLALTYMSFDHDPNQQRIQKSRGHRSLSTRYYLACRLYDSLVTCPVPGFDVTVTRPDGMAQNFRGHFTHENCVIGWLSIMIGERCDIEVALCASEDSCPVYNEVVGYDIRTFSTESRLRAEISRIANTHRV